MFGWYMYRYELPDRFCGAIAVNGFGGLIPTRDYAGKCLRYDRVIGAFHNGRQSPPPLLCSLAQSDITHICPAQPGAVFPLHVYALELCIELLAICLRQSYFSNLPFAAYQKSS